MPSDAVKIGGQPVDVAGANGANAANANAANAANIANANANAKAGAGAAGEAKASAANANASGPAQLYFAQGSASLDEQSATALAAVAQRLVASPEAHVVISGYADSSGSYAQNERLAHARASTVRTALIVAGVQDARIEMRKPAKVVATDPADQSRRVDVTLSPAAGG
nr:OmpA family protein [Paraburkholderia sacchari]